MPVYYPNVKIQRPDNLGSESWDLKDLTEVTVLFGKNGSGKSVLLRALRNAQPHITHYVTPERTGEMNSDPGLVQNELSPIERRNSSYCFLLFQPEMSRRMIGLIIRIAI